jgi:enoyl-CoA hydratase
MHEEGNGNYEYILVSQVSGVGRVHLNRPQALNALNQQMMAELVDGLKALQAESNINCILLHGSEKAFCAGADVKEMVEANAIEMYTNGFSALWDAVYAIEKPIVAAVSGHVLGGGCELAMICDIIVASETARFGQPEINIGGIPGAGGTQRLTRAVGKSLAMEIILAGRRITAQEALAAGLVSRVVPVEDYLTEAQELAADIATKSPLALRLGKEAILQSYENTLASGVRLERQLSSLTFDSANQKEAMRAFAEKRSKAT